MYQDSEFSNFLSKKLNSISPNHKLKDILQYSVLPAGKLFRPNLVLNLAMDLGGISESHLTLASSIEIHHAYTLIHDDLPSMDDDDIRRGRPSSHKKFSEWEAILAGDALLNASYELLSELKTNNLPLILKNYSKFCGAKGLILGQIKDLSNDNDSIEKILKIHELKTSRLIQNCLVNSAILSNKIELCDELSQLGIALGINFQLLDDLCELTEELNDHEQEINPFLHFNLEELVSIIQKNLATIQDITTKNNLVNLEEYINFYLNLTKKKIENGENKIESHLGTRLELKL